MLDKLAKKGLSLSIIVGTLLVPLTALAAIWLTDPDRAAEPSIPAINAASATTVTTQSPSATVDIAADLQAACGPEGMQLVTLESSRAITDVQQAALDALRELCQQQGIPLPSPPTAEPVVQTVVVPATATADPVPSSTPTRSDDDHDEHEDEHDEHEDEHDDDDDEYEYEYEFKVDD